MLTLDNKLPIVKESHLHFTPRVQRIGLSLRDQSSIQQEQMLDPDLLDILYDDGSNEAGSTADIINPEKRATSGVC